MLQFQRSSSDGKWVVYGPVDEVKLGLVKVQRQDGTETEVTVMAVNRPFQPRDKVGLHAFGIVDMWAKQRTNNIKVATAPVVTRLAYGQSARTRTAAGAALKAWLRENGMSNIKFSDLLSITPRKLYNWLDGYETPDLREATSIQHITGVQAVTWTEPLPLRGAAHVT